MTAALDARRTPGGDRPTGSEATGPVPAVVISQLSKTFGARTVLDGVSFSVGADIPHCPELRP